ncbi:glutathione S-transferase 3 [Aplysia californica]|uniref:Glutathione S-transferase 3 n=1 Tax=Aplysia californica TaxID=6500 RepID=A0ABM1VRY7_APLCA|nr:glutathione S-transferase 3 [Aplysia californica]XP_035825180.1 glutathione S-transferase 3 [Aplysia californica]
MANSRIRLHYLDVRAKAEISRLILAYAGKEYEDIRFSQEEWPNYKFKTPLQQCPMLEVDGRWFPQAAAHFTFLAREFGLYGQTNMDHLIIDVVISTLEDVYKVSVKSWYMEHGQERDEKIQTARREETPKYLAYLEQLLSENGTGYFVGNSLTLADIAAFDARTGFLKNYLVFDDRYPLLEKNSQLVLGNEKIREYVNKRNPSDV